MKRFVICLLFLFTVVWSWNTTVNYFGPENLVAEKMTGSDDKVVQKLDEVISALMEANHFTNLSVQPTLSFTSNIARRYRRVVLLLTNLWSISLKSGKCC